MLIHKFIIHVLDKTADAPILNEYEGRISQEVDKFFSKAIKKITNDDDLRKGLFNDYHNNIVQNCCEQMIYDDSDFLRNSQEIASYLFEVMKLAEDITSCDLAICLFSVKDEKYVGILKLDYKKLYTHTIELLDDKFNINMVSNEIGIPETIKIKQAAIVGLNGINDEYHFRLLDKDSEKEDTKSRFITEFLDAEKVIDDKYNTKVFKNVADNWITCALGNDVKKAEDVRSLLNYTLKEKEEINLEEFAEKSFDDDSLKESFLDLLDERGVNQSFNIDKKWVEKKLKRRSIKTDNGFDIKGNLVDFEDPMKFSIVRHNDNSGTVDIVIKNVSFYEEK